MQNVSQGRHILRAVLKCHWALFCQQLSSLVLLKKNLFPQVGGTENSITFTTAAGRRMTSLHKTQDNPGLDQARNRNSAERVNHT